MASLHFQKMQNNTKRGGSIPYVTDVNVELFANNWIIEISHLYNKHQDVHVVKFIDMLTNTRLCDSPHLRMPSAQG